MKYGKETGEKILKTIEHMRQLRQEQEYKLQRLEFQAKLMIRDIDPTQIDWETPPKTEYVRLPVTDKRRSTKPTKCVVVVTLMDGTERKVDPPFPKTEWFSYTKNKKD